MGEFLLKQGASQIEYTFFISKLYSLIIEILLAFSWFQYQNFL